MANTITNVLPKILADGVMALRQRAIMAQLVNRDLRSYAAQKGNVINVPIPSAIAARAVTPAVAFASNVDSSPTNAAVTLDQWYEAPINLSDNDWASVDPMFLGMQGSEAIKSLVNQVDGMLMGLHVNFYGFSGAAGTTPFNGSLTVAGSMGLVLSQQLADLDNRRAVINPLAEANLKLNTQVLQADQRGSREGIIDGTIGRILGFDWYMDQNVTTFTPGTGWVTGFAASTVAGAVGDTTLNIINATSSGTIKVGDIFSVGSGQYVVTAAATTTSSSGAGKAVAISFYPALATAVATSSAIAVIATAYTVNLAFHRDAIAFASRPLSGVFQSGNIFQAPTDPISGIALRLELSRQYKQETLSYDVLWGANVVRRELGSKVLG